MSKQAVFLDRDGTINEEMGYIQPPRQIYHLTSGARGYWVAQKE